MLRSTRVREREEDVGEHHVLSVRRCQVGDYAERCKMEDKTLQEAQEENVT